MYFVARKVALIDLYCVTLPPDNTPCYMKKILSLLFLLSLAYIPGLAQSEVFHTKIYNKEYDVTLRINLYEENVRIPGQEILGEVFGYLQKPSDSRVWVITGVEIDKKGRTARLEIVNDYGSEDLNAELTYNSNGTYTLRQLEGSTIKIAVNKKWVKLPKTLVFEE